ncbi:hypothetical protein [Streptomyces sp. NPDC048106]|uniref:hypothetical protein n=1 Tax=Streptomyces sp. NPDC048106 TaxID=3155750 RepID=UPI0034566B20
MPRGILYVASRPASADVEDEYNAWYDEVHLPEVCALPGFTEGRRYAPVGEDGPYVALYFMEAPDLEKAVERMKEAARSGGLRMSGALQLEPAPELRLLRLTAAHVPEHKGS